MRTFAALLAVLALAACETLAPSSAPVTARPLERSPAASRGDEAIRDALARKLAGMGPPFRAVMAESWSGRVLLMGAVIKPEQRRRAEQAAREAGATQVLNELVLAEDRALDLFRPDPTREAALRARLGGGFTIRVVNGVAFLLGQVATAEEAESIKAEASEDEGVKWVVSHLFQ